MSQNATNLANLIWSLADLLRGDFKQSQYGRIILPFALLRRLECVLAPTKKAVLAKYRDIQDTVPEPSQEMFLLHATQGLSFYNISLFDLSTLSNTGTKADLEYYLSRFSKDAREIFEHFKFSEFLALLDDANLLYEIVKKVVAHDLSPQKVSNYEMGLVFEELIRRFAESSNETAGEHFTPRDIVRLTTSLIFLEDDKVLASSGTVRTLYDPTAGTGGFLSSSMEYLHELNPEAKLSGFGQELNPEGYAICKADMLIKGQEVGNIKLGNTLTNDQLQGQRFDYMLSNPPFGVDWKKIETDIQIEHQQKGFDGRFGPGLPRVSDGSLLFLLHLLSKMRLNALGGSRIGIILNGSPLFTGGAGSGESEIRRYILENDLLEAIVALPNDMFYNTGIATYIWILSNRKSPQRKGKVQLINGVNLYSKMRKSLGSKRNQMEESDMAIITRCFGAFEEVASQELDKPAEQKSNRGRQSANPKEESAKTFACKIFPNHAFGYRRITIERPLRESYQFSDERINNLRFAPKPLDGPMRWIHGLYPSAESRAQNEGPIRKYLKLHFSELKEAKVKDVFNPKTWEKQEQIWQKALQLQQILGCAQHDNINQLDDKLRASGVTLETAEKKQILAAVSWKNPEAEKVIKKIHKGKKADPLYGLFMLDGKLVEYEADSELRDNENVPLDPNQPVNRLNESYFLREVQPHVPEAWIDKSKCDPKDGQIGIVGYEIPFNRHFYAYQPPRPLEEIDADLDRVSAEIMELLREVHS